MRDAGAVTRLVLEFKITRTLSRAIGPAYKKFRTKHKAKRGNVDPTRCSGYAQSYATSTRQPHINQLFPSKQRNRGDNAKDHGERKEVRPAVTRS